MLHNLLHTCLVDPLLKRTKLKLYLYDMQEYDEVEAEVSKQKKDSSVFIGRKSVIREAHIN